MLISHFCSDLLESLVMIPSLYMSLYRLVIDTCSGCLGTPRDIWHHFNNKQHKQVLAMLVQASEVGASSYAGSVCILCLLDVQLGYISEISTMKVKNLAMFNSTILQPQSKMV